MLNKEDWNGISYKKSLKWSIGITCISFIEYCVSIFWQNYNFLEPLRLFVLFMGVFVVPIVMCLTWGICIIQYLRQRYLICKTANRLSDFLLTFFCVICMVFTGIYTITNFRETISYMDENQNILYGLYHCLCIKIGITVGWLICFIFCVKCNEIIKENIKVWRKYILILVIIFFSIILIHYMDISEGYIYNETEQTWLKEMMEYYNEQGIDSNVVPFYRK